MQKVCHRYVVLYCPLKQFSNFCFFLSFLKDYVPYLNNFHNHVIKEYTVFEKQKFVLKFKKKLSGITEMYISYDKIQKPFHTSLKYIFCDVCVRNAMFGLLPQSE